MLNSQAVRWRIAGKGIEWNVAADGRLPHRDHIEMSGRELSLILEYGVETSGELFLAFNPVFPMLRTIPNDTHASFQLTLTKDDLPELSCDGSPLTEFPERIAFDGVLSVESRTNLAGIRIIREVFPSDDSPAFLQRLTLINASGKPADIFATGDGRMKTGRGTRGVYLVENSVYPERGFTLPAGESRMLSFAVSGRTADSPRFRCDAAAEYFRRKARIAELTAPLRLHTGIPEIDLAFHFAKLRAGESIFRTRGGLMHSPGGGSYYAATWCNDQIEYAAPYFAWTGDPAALEASMNAFRQYLPFMGPDFHPIPSSVIAEGCDIWEGAGDRGDAAMYAYGASLFALTRGDRRLALELWRGIEWSLEYCRRNLNEQGVVKSDTDELENRLPAGTANLCTSSLYYGGLLSAARLARELGCTRQAGEYQTGAGQLAADIEGYFGSSLHGFDTYRYYEGNTTLRSWIGIPLCMRILTRAAGTVDAMFSPRLWIEDGMLSQEGDRTYWDRSTLYGLRGALIAGDTGRSCRKLRDYSTRRLLGEHVPYPVEASPEGNRRHLSAESALYCRVITEGLFGLQATGFHTYRVTPRLPEGVDEISLSDIRAGEHPFDLTIRRDKTIVSGGGREFTLPAAGGEVTLSVR